LTNEPYFVKDTHNVFKETKMIYGNLQTQHTLLEVAELFSHHRLKKQYAEGRTRAAVAMILRELPGDLEILFIERATDDRDPWSGHLAFPGGKVEPGEQARQAAERETQEEIGLDLVAERYLGRMSDIIGANLPVRVSCFAYGVVTASVQPVANPEVRDVFWVKLSDLLTPERHQMSMVGFSGASFKVPAIVMPQSEKPVLWGLTYRLVMQFLEIIRVRA
jgi:8-oxo-dGTP pyrophosphatase MutT (NUDIX family)